MLQVGVVEGSVRQEAAAAAGLALQLAGGWMKVGRSLLLPEGAAVAVQPNEWLDQFKPPGVMRDSDCCSEFDCWCCGSSGWGNHKWADKRSCSNCNRRKNKIMQSQRKELTAASLGQDFAATTAGPRAGEVTAPRVPGLNLAPI